MIRRAFFRLLPVCIPVIAAAQSPEWKSVSRALDGSVRALEIFDDGCGPALFVGGTFGVPPTTGPSFLARWDGTSLTPVVGSPDWHVYALKSFTDGKESALYVGGWFFHAGGIETHYVTKWNGAQWQSLNVLNFSGMVSDLEVFDDGTGPAVYAAAEFVSASNYGAVMKHTPTGWHFVGYANGPQKGRALAVFDSDSGPALYSGGRLAFGSTAAPFLQRWQPSTATWFSPPLQPNAEVHALAVFDDGFGPALYVGGDFTVAGFVSAAHIARFDGVNWRKLGAGIDGPVYAMGVFDDGRGPALYVGGSFAHAGGVAASNVARWSGWHWEPLGQGTDQSVRALQAFGNNNAADLFAGGEFDTAGVVPSPRLARWDGANPLGDALCSASPATCPCANASGETVPHGCSHSGQVGARLAATGSRSVAQDDQVISALHLPAQQAVILIQGSQPISVPFGDGVRCAGPPILRFELRFTDSAGNVSWGPGLVQSGGWGAGDARIFQAWFRDGPGSPCGTGTNLSNAIRVTFAP